MVDRTTTSSPPGALAAGSGEGLLGSPGNNGRGYYDLPTATPSFLILNWSSCPRLGFAVVRLRNSPIRSTSGPIAFIHPVKFMLASIMPGHSRNHRRRRFQASL